MSDFESFDRGFTPNNPEWTREERAIQAEVIEEIQMGNPRSYILEHLLLEGRLVPPSFFEIIVEEISKQ